MIEQATVLVVDDEKNTRDGLKSALEEDGYKVLTAESGVTAKKIIKDKSPNVVLTDLKMPGIDGMKLLNYTRKISPEMAIILITGYGNIETAVRAIKNGAYDFITKPINLDKISAIIEKCLINQQLVLENIHLKEKLRNRYRYEELIGKSKKMLEIFDLIDQVAPTRSTVLLEGESGTGKELIANAIHQRSKRCNEPFIKLNCAALSEGILESELFGHERGAFTGAVERKKGRFELADGGTLFLDEVGEIPYHVQVKLLRVLQEREFERVGGQKTIKVDVRLVVASNQSLEQAVSENRLREDLYYRLNVIAIRIPSLRERREDIPLIAEYFIRKYSKENNKPVKGVAVQAMDQLLAHSWPGNIRELQNCLESCVVRTRGEIINAEDLPPSIFGRGIDENKIIMDIGSSIEEIEQEAILKTLNAVNGSKTQAARILKIGLKTLYRKLEKYNSSRSEQLPDSLKSSI